ncbi:hypothetical protein [Thioclava indica]|uniref:Uncharacterized protein n=1 Tax=Thioclava indica TaxID=1353528 RepID=A0A074K0A3_9RHOB|nr:hypothetical protein [Thioclava indica]KEO61600.1 hypothetical protein DT23_01115 [Thioclava indica]
MKHIIATSAVLALLAGTASAANTQMHQRHAPFPNGVTATQTASVPADSVYSNKELERAHLTPTELVKVTVIPAPDYIIPSKHDN